MEILYNFRSMFSSKLKTTLFEDYSIFLDKISEIKSIITKKRLF